ncbi:unnamed protein product [Callosobruchus maculatus]|uniref:Uncharacterized protein n=1 Tax=Callosobruchus maculatus TaxID=64391 RepID=A0A653DXJ5_CALMS|nr:unnamed protein product [Callosobruchus maculatus]
MHYFNVFKQSSYFLLIVLYLFNRLVFSLESEFSKHYYVMQKLKKAILFL